MAVQCRAAADYEHRLRERVNRWSGPSALAELTEPVLRRIAASEGIDFATALLYDRIVRSPEHVPFIARLESMPVRAAGSADGSVGGSSGKGSNPNLMGVVIGLGANLAQVYAGQPILCPP